MVKVGRQLSSTGFSILTGWVVGVGNRDTATIVMGAQLIGKLTMQGRTEFVVEIGERHAGSRPGFCPDVFVSKTGRLCSAQVRKLV